MPLVTISSQDHPPQPYSFDIERQLVGIGRGASNDIIPAGSGVSTNHAQMERVSGGFILRDLGSTNGVEINGIRMDVIDLIKGTTVKLGDVSFVFDLSDEELMALSEEPFTPHQRVAEGFEPASAPPAAPIEPIAEPTFVPHSPPPPPSAARSLPKPARYHEERSSGPLGGLLFLILTVASIAGGIAYRHHKETGRNIIDDIRPAIEESGEKAPAPTEP